MSWSFLYRLHGSRWYIKTILPVLLLFVMQTIAAAACVTPIAVIHDVPMQKTFTQTTQIQYCQSDIQSNDNTAACVHCEATQNLDILSNNANSIADASQFIAVTTEIIVVLPAMHLLTQTVSVLPPTTNRYSGQHSHSSSPSTSIIYQTSLRIRT